MKKPSSQTQGYLFLAAALVLFCIGSYFKEPVLAHHKLLAATGHEDGGVFEKAVILVLTHTPGGAMGLILNKDDNGGPVGMEKIYVLHSPDVMLDDSILIDDLALAYATGEEAAQELQAAAKKPEWYAVVKGYTGWGPKQLDREIRREVWKVIDYDASILKTPQDKMHAEAIKEPEAILNAL